jgi:hypothetical protein
VAEGDLGGFNPGVKAAGLTGAFLVLVACSSAALPPSLPDCVATDAAVCSVSTVTAGGPPGEGGTEGTCAVNSGDSQCTQCANANCCTFLTTCFESSDPDCKNLFSCEEICEGLASCASDCLHQYPTAETTFDELESCVAAKCPVCNEAGVGDPCIPGETACIAGLTCVDSWCTKACTDEANCVGLGPEGGNAVGAQNACIATGSSGIICFPGCVTNADCSSFPGTYCFMTTSADGASVLVCTNLPDAGTD